MVFTLLTFQTQAQSIQFPDLIVTRAGDSLRCTIVQEDAASYYLRVPDSTKGIKRIGLARHQAAFFQLGFYTVPYIAPAGWPTDENGRLRRVNGLKKNYFRVGGGPSKMLGQIESQWTGATLEHIKALRSSLAVNLDFEHYTNSWFGLAAHADYFSSQHSMDKQSDNISAIILSVGPVFRLPLGKSISYFYLKPNIGFGTSTQDRTIPRGTTSSSIKLPMFVGAGGLYIGVSEAVGIHINGLICTPALETSFLGNYFMTRSAVTRIGASCGLGVAF